MMEIVGGLIRLLSAFAMGALVNKAHFDPTSAEAIIGGAGTIITGLWSAAAKSDKFPAIKF